jgi:hypothetical protein
MSGYTIVNLTSDFAALGNSVKDALTKTNPTEVRNAWIDVGINSAKVTAGIAELAANDPKWAGLLGSAATLTSVEESTRRIPLHRSRIFRHNNKHTKSCSKSILTIYDLFPQIFGSKST